MPQNITLFERLLYASLALEVIESLLGSHSAAEQALDFGGLGTGFDAISWAFTVFLIWLAARGRKNWARWTLASSFAGTVLWDVLGASDPMAGSWTTAALEMGQLVLQGLAYYLAYTGEGAAWFTPQPEPRRRMASGIDDLE